MKEIKLRYLKYATHFIPEFSWDNIKWERWKEKELKNTSLGHILELLTINNYNFFTDTSELYIKNEMYVNAFLGAAKIYYKKEIIEFENVN